MLLDTLWDFLKEDVWKAMLAVSLGAVAWLYRDMKKYQSMYHETRDSHVHRLETLHAEHDEKIQRQNDLTLATQKDFVHQMKAANDQSTSRFLELFERFYAIQASIQPLLSEVKENNGKIDELETRISGELEDIRDAVQASKGASD